MSVPFRLVYTIRNVPYTHRTLLSVFFEPIIGTDLVPKPSLTPNSE